MNTSTRLLSLNRKSLCNDKNYDLKVINFLLRDLLLGAKGLVIVSCPSK